MGIASDIIVIIIVAFFSGLIMLKLGQPIILGYILSGIILGSYTSIINESKIHDIEFLAEIGVALLLFALGLEFSFKDIREVKGIALIGTPIQIICVTLFGFSVGKFLGWEWKTCIWFGCLISLSSTMVILKSLMGQGWLGTLSSKVMIGMLIVQDLAVIPMLIVLPKLNNSTLMYKDFIFAGLKASLFIFSMFFIGTKILPYILSYIAKLASRELFILATTAIGLGIGYLTYKIGLSFAFGAFVAGMILSESDYGHQALSDIIPLRDIFGMLFFTSVGMLLNPNFLIENIKTISFLVIIISIFKGTLFVILSKIFKYKNVVPIALGLGLFQVGEFSFLIARLGYSTNSIDEYTYNIFLTVAIITMILTPLISAQTAKIYALKKKLFKNFPIEVNNIPKNTLTNHIVISGGGRIGFQLSEILKKLGFSFVVIELDQRRVSVGKEKKIPIIYGDVTHDLVLHAAEIEKATMLVVTNRDIVTSTTIIKKSRLLNKDVKIISLGTAVEFCHRFQELGVNGVVIPEFEAGVEMSREVLSRLGVKLWDIHHITESLRNRIFSQYFTSKDSKNTNYKTLKDLSSAERSFNLEWIEITENNFLLGKSIKQGQIREKTGVSIVGIISNDELIKDLDIDFIFQINDKVAILASNEKIKFFKEWCLTHE